MLCTSISMPRLFMQPSFRPYPSISSPIISLPLRRNNTFPIRVPTSSESQTKTEIKSKANPKQSQFKIFSSQSQISSSATTTTATTAVEESPAAPKDSSGSDVIGKFYGGINAHDLGSVEDLIAENCIYEDLIFPQPFVGRKAILEFFNKFINSISTDLQFVIDDISNEDSSAVGVSWHLEGKIFSIQQRMQLLPFGHCQWEETDYIWARQCGTCYQAWGGSFGFYQRSDLAVRTVSKARGPVMRIVPAHSKLYPICRYLIYVNLRKVGVRPHTLSLPDLAVAGASCTG
ncbi:uncharacterized protein LOC122091973 isoform X1 [Macadamia integrifolia]|uniref:uncharacterized protein LOC122091973 isoform X1 n=1 Tax=Macadamia integrifolia TaxID=60698 RepID=UPI001C4FE090|nr:uncharacterized protein LOC122091973 isoform X1 [Macadamia integrifolia]